MLIAENKARSPDATHTSSKTTAFARSQHVSAHGTVTTVLGFDCTLISAALMARTARGSDAERRFREGEFKSLILMLAPTDPASWRSAIQVAQRQSEHPTEILSRSDTISLVQAILQQASEESWQAPLRYADIVLDRRRQGVFRGEIPIALTPTEFSLLEFFLVNPELIVSRETILEHVWQHDLGANTHVVPTYVHYLRKKLEALGPPLIRTVRRAGYVLDPKPR